MKITRLLFALLYLSCVAMFAQSTIAPKIIKTIPAIGATNVGTNLKEIIIKFDQVLKMIKK